MHSWQGFTGGIQQVVLITVLCFKWSVKKKCVAKVLQGVWERFLYENNHKSDFYKFNNKLADIPVLPFPRNQKQELNFQQDLATRIFFCLYWVALFFKRMPNLIGFYKKIFWHVIASCIIVPWLEVLTKKIVHLTSWRTGKKLIIVESCWSTNLLQIFSHVLSKPRKYFQGTLSGLR